MHPSPSNSFSKADASYASALSPLSTRGAAANPTCPRCAYDLRGAIDAWKTECPLEGKCPECGLDYAWRDVLNLALTFPKWSFEHAHSRLPLRLAQTMLRALWPWGIMRAVRMEHPIAPRRLIILFVSQILFAHAAFAIAVGVAVAEDYCVQFAMYGSIGNTPIADRILLAALWPYKKVELFSPTVVVEVIPVFYPIALIYFTVIPIAFLTLPDTLKRCRVRKAHILRAAAYSIALPCALLSLCLVLQIILMIIGAIYPKTLGSTYSITQSAGHPYHIIRKTLDFICLFTPLILTLLAPFFWWAATKRYLRLPHAFAIAFMFSVIAFLATTLILMLNPWFGPSAR